MTERIELFKKIQNTAEITEYQDPLCKLILNYEDIKNIYQKYTNDKKIFYFCKEKIKEILYDSEKVFDFNDNIKEKNIVNDSNFLNLSELFYLSLLVSYNYEQIDYQYDLEYIKIIMNNFEKNKDMHDTKKLAICKIIYSLLNNYLGYNGNENENINEINKIQKNIKNIIENLKVEYDYNVFCKNKIDYIYLQIINSLIINKQFNNYNVCNDIINQLDLENIDITLTIFKGLSETLNNKKDNYMNNYIINNISDLSNETKINFYYIIIKYILKDTIYVFNIEFLYENIKKLKSFFNKFKTNNNNNEKLEEIMNILYPKINIKKKVICLKEEIISNNFNNSNGNINNSISGFSVDYQNALKSFYDGKQQEKSRFSSYFNTNDFEDNSSNPSYLSTNNILNNPTPHKKQYIAKKIFDKFQFQLVIIFHELNELEKGIYFQNMICGHDKKEIVLEDLKDEYKYYENSYNIKEQSMRNNFKKFILFLHEIDDYINISKIKINALIDVKLYKDKNIERKNKEDKNLYNCTCIYKFKNMAFKDVDILVNGINSKTRGFLFLINELCNPDNKQ